MATVEPARDRALQDYRKKLLEHKEVESRLKESKFSISLGKCLKVMCAKMTSHLYVFGASQNLLFQFQLQCANN